MSDRAGQDPPDHSRARSATRLREPEVFAVARPTPRTVRITLGGPDLAGLPHAAPDGYLKLFFPLPGHAAPRLPGIDTGDDAGDWYRTYLALPDDVRPPMRTYTLRRRRDAGDGSCEIDVDFVLHGQGPAHDWALDAVVGDRLGLLGPYGLWAPRPEHDTVVLVGDETAVPAAAAIAESLPAGTRALVLLEVADEAEHVAIDSPADVDARWLHGRAGRSAGVGSALLETLRAVELPGERPYVWLAGEAATVRDLRRHVVRERGVDRRDVCFTGYWRRGRTEEQASREALAAVDRGEDPSALE